MALVLLLFAFIGLVRAHGYVKSFTVDGTDYPAFNPITDHNYAAIKRIEWGWTGQNTFGVGPVLDVTGPDVACRANAMAPKLAAPIRAGAKIQFKWTDYFTSHKGPVMTYIGPFAEQQKVTDVQWTKFDEISYDPKTGVYGSDMLLKNNNTWSVQIPSDLKPGLYVVRHELIALHFAHRGSASGPATLNNGAESYPVCINVRVSGNGNTIPPPAGTFPGLYHRNDPGLLTNIYYGANKYITPGPAVWKGRQDPPVGPRPVVKETGFPQDASGKASAVAASKGGDKVFEGLVAQFNKGFPGGGGDRKDAGNGALHMGAPNKGMTGPLGVVPKDGSVIGPPKGKSPYPTFGPPNNAGSVRSQAKGRRIVAVARRV